MNKQIISTNNAPAAIGPYSQGISLENLIFVSGQIPVNPETGEIAKDIREQTKQSMKNIESILKQSGASLNDVVKITIFVTDLSNFTDVNEVYGSFFTENYPARSCVEVSKLPKGVGIEIEAIAVRK